MKPYARVRKVGVTLCKYVRPYVRSYVRNIQEQGIARAGDTNLLNLGHTLIKLGIHGYSHGYSMSIWKKFVGIRSIFFSKIGRVFVIWGRCSCIFSIFSKCSNRNTFFEYFRILWDTLGYFEILCGIPIPLKKWNTQGYLPRVTLNTFRIPFEYHGLTRIVEYYLLLILNTFTKFGNTTMNTHKYS